MCGIAGYVGDRSVECLQRMLATLAHRGPDDTGTYVEPGVGLGMTRLAIIDLPTGHQPITNEDGTAWIVFNGEIYNYRALRTELEARGHRFKTRSDTEVILHAWEEHGEACVERLAGMFAFAIWDGAHRALFLARDRLGKKPMYYCCGPDGFVFASEARALLQDRAVPRALDWDALHHYLAFGYTPGDRTIFARIAKLAPGHTATLRDGIVTARRYWTLPVAAPDPRLSFEEAAHRVRTTVRDAVRARLESEVPLGVFLSGGVDSSAVVASLREVTGARLRTFSIGFGHAAPAYDELRYARLVAERFDTDHHEEILEPKVADVLRSIVAAFDEPFADSSAVPTFVIAQATARHVKVALSGIGGDETFAGYPRHLGVRVSERYAKWPRSARLTVARVVHRLPGRETPHNWVDRARRFVDAAETPLPGRYVAWTRFFAEEDLERLVSSDVRSRWTVDIEARHRAAFASHTGSDLVDGALRVDLATYLPDDLLVMADRMTMAHSLELRAPFCDHRLVEESLRVPSRLKVPGARLKAVLKRAFADVLPREVLEHPKQGFMIPLGVWLCGELKPLMDDLLDSDRVRHRGVFVPAAVETLKQEHLSRRQSHGDRLWALMMFEAWAREYLDEHGTWSAT